MSDGNKRFEIRQSFLIWLRSRLASLTSGCCKLVRRSTKKRKIIYLYFTLYKNFTLITSNYIQKINFYFTNTISAKYLTGLNLTSQNVNLSKKVKITHSKDINYVFVYPVATLTVPLTWALLQLCFASISSHATSFLQLSVSLYCYPKFYILSNIHSGINLLVRMFVLVSFVFLCHALDQISVRGHVLVFVCAFFIPFQRT